MKKYYHTRIHDYSQGYPKNKKCICNLSLYVFVYRICIYHCQNVNVQYNLEIAVECKFMLGNYNVLCDLYNGTMS